MATLQLNEAREAILAQSNKGRKRSKKGTQAEADDNVRILVSKDTSLDNIRMEVPPQIAKKTSLNHLVPEGVPNLDLMMRARNKSIT